jgi:hypothetical protein
MVNCIKRGTEPGVFYSSGEDGKILKWNSSLKPEVLFDIKTVEGLNYGLPGVTAFDFAQSQNGLKCLIGTKGAMVLTYDCQAKEV